MHFYLMAQMSICSHNGTSIVLGQARLNFLVCHMYLISETVGGFVGTCTVK